MRNCVSDLDNATGTSCQQADLIAGGVLEEEPRSLHQHPLGVLGGGRALEEAYQPPSSAAAAS
jgi:hypothetical protein